MQTEDPRPSGGWGWRARASRIIRQHPLIETTPSMNAFAAAEERPRTIFMGFGLCAQDQLTEAVPIDILGMILPAEALRRAVGADQIVVLLADQHAMQYFPQRDVQERAEQYLATLERAQDNLPVDGLSVLRASELHEAPGFAERLASIQARADEGMSEYLLLQAADLALLHARHGPLLKLGWCLSRAPTDVEALYDERGFDAFMESLTGLKVPFVYTKPGRVLDDDRRKAVPYVVKDPDKRVCLEAGEAPLEKIEAALDDVSMDTYRGVRRHLTAIARAYADLEPEASTCVTARLETLVQRLAA